MDTLTRDAGAVTAANRVIVEPLKVEFGDHCRPDAQPVAYRDHTETVLSEGVLREQVTTTKATSYDCRRTKQPAVTHSVTYWPAS
jgi:hypothetical protein